MLARFIIIPRLDPGAASKQISDIRIFQHCLSWLSRQPDFNARGTLRTESNIDRVYIETGFAKVLSCDTKIEAVVEILMTRETANSRAKAFGSSLLLRPSYQVTRLPYGNRFIDAWKESLRTYVTACSRVYVHSLIGLPLR